MRRRLPHRSHLVEQNLRAQRRRHQRRLRSGQPAPNHPYLHNLDYRKRIALCMKRFQSVIRLMQTASTRGQWRGSEATMKLRSVTVLALSLAFASYGSLALRAQDASVAPGTEIDSCVRWMRATVSGGVTRTLDPADFCSGIKTGSTDGWYSIWKCGQLSQQVTGTTPRYCTSSGQLTTREAWAAG